MKHPKGADANAGRRRFLTAMASGILGGGAIRTGPGASAVSAWTGIETNSVLNQARPLDTAAGLKIVKIEPLILRLKNPGGDWIVDRRERVAKLARAKQIAQLLGIVVLLRRVVVCRCVPF